MNINAFTVLIPSAVGRSGSRLGDPSCTKRPGLYPMVAHTDKGFADDRRPVCRSRL